MKFADDIAHAVADPRGDGAACADVFQELCRQLQVESEALETILEGVRETQIPS